MLFKICGNNVIIIILSSPHFAPHHKVTNILAVVSTCDFGQLLIHENLFLYCISILLFWPVKRLSFLEIFCLTCCFSHGGCVKFPSICAVINSYTYMYVHSNTHMHTCYAWRPVSILKICCLSHLFTYKIVIFILKISFRCN